MPLSGHVFVWVFAVALSGMATGLVRAYATRLERRRAARTERVLEQLARAAAVRSGASTVDGAERARST